ncbi:MAG: hypothetical protein GY875_20495 [Gammaproteobacteria bacterium]|nr:hypothetical protein [Gammaproteobacteria bacterium]
MKRLSAILPAFLLALFVSPAFGATVYDIGAGKPYAIIQLGNNGGDSTSSGSASGGDKLEITSNSSVFGSTLKGKDKKSELNKLSTSKITGSWDKETGVSNDKSSSYTGSQDTLSVADFNDIAADAVAASVFWAGQAGTNIGINVNSSIKTIDVSGIADGVAGGANVFNVTSGFILNSGAKLILDGDPGDFFVFNISEDRLFSMQSNSIIELAGDIEASEVLFNVLGNIGSAVDDGALIGGGSIFQGTLLAPGRKVEITQNHFYTFDSEGFMGTQAPETTEITAAQAILEKETNDSSWGGLFGQIVAGGAINFTESDIAHHPFMTMPPPAIPVPPAVWLFGTALAGLLGFSKRRKSKLAAG